MAPVESEPVEVDVDFGRRLRNGRSRRVESDSDDDDDEDAARNVDLPMYWCILYEQQDKQGRVLEIEGVLEVSATELIVRNMNGQQTGKASNVTVQSATRTVFRSCGGVAAQCRAQTQASRSASAPIA